MAAKKTGIIGKSKLSGLVETLLLQDALPGEHDDFPADAAKEAARFIASAALKRTEGEAAIAVDRLETGKGRCLTRIVIVNDNMPFLVDSLAQGLSARAIDLRRILHPMMKAERDSAGRLIGARAREDDAPGRVESLIYMEAGWVGDEEREALAAEIAEILADVRAATADWLTMKTQLGEAADSLPEGEGRALLEWLLDDRFTLIGCERLSRTGRRTRRLGLSARRGEALIGSEAVERAVAWLEDGNAGPLLIKSNIVSPVHRRVLLDLLVVPVCEDGGIVALDVIAGLWTSAALLARPTEVPMMRAQLAQMFDRLGFDPGSHAGKALVHAMTQLPHDLLIGFSIEEQQRIALAAMSIADRPRPNLLLVQSPLRRHSFAFVWVPRDDVSTGLRKAVADMLTDGSRAEILSWSIGLEDGQVALLRFTLDMRDCDNALDEAALDKRLKTMVRGWQPAIDAALREIGVGDRAAELAREHSELFSAGYRLEYGADEAARDILRIATLEARETPAEASGEVSPSMGGEGGRLSDARLYRREDDEPCTLRLKIYHLGGPVPLSDAVPALENFGFVVREERPSALDRPDRPHIHDFALDLHAAGEAEALLSRSEPLERAIVAVLVGEAENDPFNALMTQAGLDQNAVVWLRAFFRYLRQTGLSYSILTVRSALARAPEATRAIITLFHALHEPEIEDREKKAKKARAAFTAALEQVAALDEDRILRLMCALVEACCRTNAFTLNEGEALAFKIDSEQVPGLPKPVPWREIFVYSPRLEGVHLRAGSVARGGIRWSDRRDDFRTEILDLMKAQRVKNAVIVPTGAKGGFFPKQLPDPQVDRDAWAAEGQQCYRIYIRSLLSLTDDLSGDTVKHPAGVVLRDGDDPYFVVAADKGTARFSDTANAIAEERGFWLDDAFASGGSNGYDHKAMGITARGAWRSVTQHFAELGIGVQSDPVRVVGVGDMSGDVFGNGMLLSKSLKLVAAFDHRHIFIDPDPDPESSWHERNRLFGLDRSSWDDYDKRRISKGGGVFSRAAKKIPLSPEMRDLLDLSGESIDPPGLLSAILRCRIDLLWFGGIGTYVKGAGQSNAEVGDPGNDRIRIDGGEIGARVVGEGANLGVTQAGRIEYALAGGRINTDFIDNSAGVDCSDNEVNIKIALNTEQRAGKLDEKARNRLLGRMTDQVAAIVLEDNRLQALGLSIAEHGGADAAAAYVRLIERLEMAGRLDREVEGLADNETLLRRAQDGKGLQRPELAVLFSTAKLSLQEAIEQCGIGQAQALDGELLAAFPKKMRKAHGEAILKHRLREPIVATKVANRIVNRLGLLHPFELAEEEGASLGQLAEAYWVVETLFDLNSLFAAIDEADLSERSRIALFARLGRAVRVQMADLARTGLPQGEPGALLATLEPQVKRVRGSARRLINDHLRESLERECEEMVAEGVPEALAERVVDLRRLDGLFGIVELAARREADPVAVAEAFVAVGRRLGLDWVSPTAAELNPSDPWDRLLLAGVIRDMQQMRLEFLGRTRANDFDQFIDNWFAAHPDRIAQFCELVTRAREATSCSVAILAQVAQHARMLLSR